MSGKLTTWHISGMSCPHCDQAILKAVSGLDGLTAARADYRKGTLTAEWDSTVLPEKVLIEQVEAAGYTVKPQAENLTAVQRLLRIILLLAVLTGLFALLALTPVRTILSAFPVARAGMSLGALFVLGLMTSLHCVAMCGGINLAQSAGAAQAGNKVSQANLLYNGGRLISYTVAGGIVGAIGSVFRLSIPVQAGIQIFAAIFMALMALNLLDIEFLRGWVPTLPDSLRNRLIDQYANNPAWRKDRAGCLYGQIIYAQCAPPPRKETGRISFIYLSQLSSQLAIEQLLEGEVPADTNAAGGHIADAGVDDNALLDVNQRLDDVEVLGMPGIDRGQNLVDGLLRRHGHEGLDLQLDILEIRRRSGNAFNLALGQAALLYPVIPPRAVPADTRGR